MYEPVKANAGSPDTLKIWGGLPGRPDLEEWDDSGGVEAVMEHHLWTVDGWIGHGDITHKFPDMGVGAVVHLPVCTPIIIARIIVNVFARIRV